MNFKKSFKRAFLLISPFLYHLASGQEGDLRHFERKTEIEKILLPNDSFDEKLFKIPFPTEIYNSGEIILKKPILKSIKMQSIDLEFENYIYKEVEYCAKAKNKNSLDALLKVNSIADFKIKDTKKGSKICYHFSH